MISASKYKKQEETYLRRLAAQFAAKCGAKIVSHIVLPCSIFDLVHAVNVLIDGHIYLLYQYA